MKAKLLTLIYFLISMVSFAQDQIKPKNIIQYKQTTENLIYQLFPTQNYWTFIKLDTRNGKMWQVHFSVKGSEERGEVKLNTVPLINKDAEEVGRFTLYPTENMYNFILLDQIDGFTYQVQWSMKETERMVIPIE